MRTIRRLARWECAVPLLVLCACGSGAPNAQGATLDVPGTPGPATAPVHPVLEAYRATVESWMTEEERRALAAVDVGASRALEPRRLRDLAIDRLVHRFLPLALEAQGDPALVRRAAELREAPAYAKPGGDVAAARTIDESLAVLRNDRAETGDRDGAMREYVDAFATYAEAYADAMGVSQAEADLAAAAVADVVFVAVVVGRIALRPGADRRRIAREAIRLLDEMAELARASTRRR